MIEVWKTESQEPLDWIDSATGLACRMLRGPCGQWNGYVRVPEGPLHGADYSERFYIPKEVAEPQLAETLIEQIGVINAFCFPFRDARKNLYSIDLLCRCHGGLTFSGQLSKNEPDEHWFGFDCSHSGDLTPDSFARGWVSSDDVYRTQEYVQQSCTMLAADLFKWHTWLSTHEVRIVEITP